MINEQLQDALLLLRHHLVDVIFLGELANQSFEMCHSNVSRMSEKVQKSFARLLKRPRGTLYSMLCTVHTSLNSSANDTAFKKYVRKRYNFFQETMATVNNPAKRHRQCSHIDELLRQMKYEVQAMQKTIRLSRSALSIKC